MRPQQLPYPILQNRASEEPGATSNCQIVLRAAAGGWTPQPLKAPGTEGAEAGTHRRQLVMMVMVMVVVMCFLFLFASSAGKCTCGVNADYCGFATPEPLAPPPNKDKGKDACAGINPPDEI